MGIKHLVLRLPLLPWPHHVGDQFLGALQYMCTVSIGIHKVCCGSSHTCMFTYNFQTLKGSCFAKNAGLCTVRVPNIPHHILYATCYLLLDDVILYFTNTAVLISPVCLLEGSVMMGGSLLCLRVRHIARVVTVAPMTAINGKFLTAEQYQTSET